MATLSHNTIDSVTEQIESINARCDEIWNSRGNFGRQKQTKQNMRLMTEKIRPLDLLREQLFHTLWNLYLEADEDVDLEHLSKEKIFNGRKHTTRITWCDGIFHYVTNNSDEFQYGYVCTC